MAARGKGSALADVAADLPNEGTGAALTGGRAENPGGEAAAGDLFGALDLEAAAFDGATIGPPKRGRGRPAGSLNRSTREMKRWLDARGYRDPLEFLASIYTMDTRELAVVLRGLPAATASDPVAIGAVTFDQAAEALRMQMRAASEAIPYLHQRTPMQVEHSGDAAARPLIMIVDGAAGVRAVDGGDGAMSAFDLADFSRISQVPADAAASKSHDEGSHDDR